MTKPFDTTTRQLLEEYTEAWLAYLGLVPDGPIRVRTRSMNCTGGFKC
jgi:hypothetical protein